MKTGLNNILQPTLFTVVNNIEQYCYTRFRLNSIVQYCWQLWTKHCSNLLNSGLSVFARVEMEELSWITKDAAQPDRVEGFLRVPLAATLWLMSDHGAQLRLKGHLGNNPNSPCQHSLWEETGAPGENPRLSVECWLTLFTWVSTARMEPMTSEAKDDCAPPKSY
jgi:hypothetical protein